MNETNAPWDVLLIGGASGTGKSSLSYAVARHFGVGVTEIDDLYTAVKRMTTAGQQPVLHYWDTHPEAMSWSAESILDLHRSVCRVLEPAVGAVVADHVAGTPVILEGDYLSPEGAANLIKTLPSGAVRAVFLVEDDETQLVRNFASREPGGGEQYGRARASRLFGEWLKSECDRLGLVALSARPWGTLLERTLRAVGAPDEVPNRKAVR